MHPNSLFKFEVKGNYIGGEFVKAKDPSGEWVSKSPADLSDELGRFQYSYKAVDDSVTTARRALPSWRRTALSARIEILKKYQAALKRRESELVEAISREVGKPQWESKTELAAMINKVDVTIQDSLPLVKDYELPKIMEGTTGACRYRPMGVCAVIGPFNFPGHLANGHIVPALITGNAVIFKPSEKSPLVGQLMAECLHEAGVPAGVFSLVQGEKEVGRRLVTHEGVDAVFFTGSYEVGTRIKQDTLLQHWKLLALEMGGKNPALVWRDADLDLAVQEVLVGAFLTAGQRCSATSRVLVHTELLEAFVAKLHERAKAFDIGHPLDNPFMGSLIDHGSVDRYTKFIGIASREGFDVVMRGKQLELPYKGYYVTPTICMIKEVSVEAARKSVYQQSEIFGPNVAVMGVDDFEQAIELCNVTQYGLAASVYTKDRALYERAWDGLAFGLINWNKTTVGASSRLPFGGLKKSGNHFPTAQSATLYCTSPVASLEVAEPKPATGAGYTGLNWK